MALRGCVFAPLFAAAFLGTVRAEIGWIESAVLFCTGLLVWTALEYLMHRFAFHGFAPHYQHHAEPAQRSYILAPVWLSASGATVLWLSVWAITQSWGAASWLLAGVVAGYLMYELVHLRIHSAVSGGRLLRALRKRHYHHHFANEHASYGVTSPLWDFVFATLPERGMVSGAEQGCSGRGSR